MLFCVRCGAPSEETRAYCTSCGAVLYQPSVQAAPVIPPTDDRPSEPAPVVYNPSIPPTPYGQPQPWFTPYSTHPLPTLPDAPVLQFHPLAQNTRGLPLDLLSYPQRFYSYINAENRLVFARRSAFSNRLGAAILDLIIVGIPYFAIAVLLLGGEAAFGSGTGTTASRPAANPVAAAWSLAAGMLIFFSYFFFTALKNGQSIGKRTLRIRVMKLDGSPPDKWTIAVRFLCGYMMSTNLLAIAVVVLIASLVINSLPTALLLSLLAFGWGFWWCGWDALKQGWHDKLARTLVVDVNEYVEGFHFEKIPPPPVTL